MASIFPTGLTYSRNTKDPLQSKIVWGTLADASVYVNNPDETAYVGMTLAVTNDGVEKNNGLWYVEAIGTKANPTGGVLKKVGSNEVLTADNFSAAVVLAKTAPVGTLIKVTASEGSVETDDFHAAGFYIVSVSGAEPSILMLSTTSGEDMDLDAVISALSTLESTVNNKADKTSVYTKTDADATFIKDVTGDGVTTDHTTGMVTVDMSSKLDKSTFDTFEQNTNDALGRKLEANDLADYAKTADVVAADTYATDKQNIDDAIEALNTEVGAPAEGEAAATGIYKVIADAVDALEGQISSIPKFKIEVVAELPAEGDAATVYLVTEKETDGDLYTEYIYVNGAWENLGKQTVDLSGYSTTTEMNTAIADAITALGMGDYYKKGEVDNLLGAKADTTALDNYVKTEVLNNYVTTTDFNTYKGEVSTTLGDYVTTKTFTDYQGTVSTELAKKLENSDLETALADYVTTTGLETTLADYVTATVLETTLADYVTATGLETTLASYATKQELTDGLALKADASALNDYVLKSTVETSESVAFVNGALEVNTITSEELDDIINPKA